MSEPEPRPHEPIFQAPWPALALVAFILLCFAAQAWAGLEPSAKAFGFTPATFAAGHWATIVTAMFVHGGVVHVAANSAFILAFGTPVARRMGVGPAGALAYLLFFLVCGIAGNLLFWALHPREVVPLVGASGAGSGLMAAASRLLTPGRRLAPLLSRPVVVMALVYAVANAIIGVVGWAPGAGDALVAWEAHLGGYAAGLFLFAPFLAALGRLWRGPITA